MNTAVFTAFPGQRGGSQRGGRTFPHRKGGAELVKAWVRGRVRGRVRVTSVLFSIFQGSVGIERPGRMQKNLAGDSSRFRWAPGFHVSWFGVPGRLRWAATWTHNGPIWLQDGWGTLETIQDVPRGPP